MRPYRIVGRSSYRPYGTFALLVIFLAFFVWEIFITAQSGMPIEEIYDGYALVTCNVGKDPFFEVLLDGVRSIFLHLSFAQLVTNMLFLWVFAPRVEEYFGHRRFIWFFLIAGFGGHIASVLFGSEECMALVGPNGAIAGTLAAFLFLFPATRIDVAFPVVDRSFNLPAVLVILVYLALAIFMEGGGPLSGQLSPYWDEIGGMVTGAVFIFVATMLKPAPPVDPFEHLDRD